MIKNYATAILCVIATATQAQINITQNEMPSAGDTARITIATVNPFINYGATGANFSWNFANLRNNGQDLKSYQSVSSTNVVYSLFYANIPFNPNRANVVTPGSPIPANPLLTINDPYNFYYRSSSVYKQVGFGAEVAGIPLPVAYSQQDIVYNLPLNFGNADTSESAWNIGLPGLGYYGFAQTRINEVDGWGSLITPHGTYNVLRVKTQLYARDTIAVDSLSLNFALDRPKTTEYKWLAANEIVPVLQITTTELLGFEVVTEIFYRDDYNTVQPGVLNAAYCARSTITLPYLTTGSYNPPAFLQTANVFTAQLSDSSGSFASPVNIGNVTATTSGNVTVTIPSNTIPGTHYRIRFTSSSPAVTGGDNGFDIIIEGPAISSIVSSGNTAFCAGDSVMLQSNSVDAGYSYQWQLNGGDIIGANSTSYYVTSSGNYLLNTSNSCGPVASNAIAVTVNPLPVANINTPSGTSICAGDSLVLTAVSDSSYSYQWLLNGVGVPGEITSSLSANQAGDYSVVVSTATCGSDTSLSVNITVAPAPVSVISASGPLSVCAGDSVSLSATTGIGYSYQWQLNSVDIQGEVASTINVNTSGTYTAAVTNTCGTLVSNSIAVTVFPAPNAPIISLQTDSLVSTAAVSYQWYYAGTAISGAVSGFYVPTQNGAYTVVTTDANGCTAVSSIFAMTTVGVSSISLQDGLSIFPNPSNDMVSISGQASVSNLDLKLFSATGQVVNSTNASVIGGLFKVELNISNLSKGVYFLQVTSNNAESYFKVIKK